MPVSLAPYQCGQAAQRIAGLGQGEWVEQARKNLGSNVFSNPTFAPLLFIILFAVTLGLIMSVWWQRNVRFDERVREAERIDAGYREALQSRLQRYGDYVAGLGFDATLFPDEKFRIFEGIRERASLSIEGMPRELGGG
ncbi:MAG TPA: hypothetical protein VIS76_05650 [Pseudomonadales bacterium]